MLMSSGTRIVVGLRKFSRERFYPICINLRILPIKTRNKYPQGYTLQRTVVFLTKCLNSRSRQLLITKKHDTWKLVEHRVPGPGFTNSCVKYCAPHLISTLPKTICQVEKIEISKKRLNTYIFSETLDLESNKFVIAL